MRMETARRRLQSPKSNFFLVIVPYGPVPHRQVTAGAMKQETGRPDRHGCYHQTRCRVTSLLIGASKNLNSRNVRHLVAGGNIYLFTCGRFRFRRRRKVGEVAVFFQTCAQLPNFAILRLQRLRGTVCTLNGPRYANIHLMMTITHVDGLLQPLAEFLLGPCFETKDHRVLVNLFRCQRFVCPAEKEEKKEEKLTSLHSMRKKIKNRLQTYTLEATRIVVTDGDPGSRMNGRTLSIRTLRILLGMEAGPIQTL